MSIESVQSYLTPDGQLFLNEQEALLHTNKSSYAERAKAFVDSKTVWGKGQATRAINIIEDFLSYETLNS